MNYVDQQRFIIPEQVCYQFTDDGGFESLLGLDEKSEPRTWNGGHAIAGVSSGCAMYNVPMKTVPTPRLIFILEPFRRFLKIEYFESNKSAQGKLCCAVMEIWTEANWFILA